MLESVVLLTFAPLTHRRLRHELAGARPPKFLTAGARGHNRIYGAPVKKIKKINEQAKYSAKEVFSVSSLGNGHTATHQQLCRSHCVLCRRRQQSDTASVRRHPVSQSGKHNPESTHIFCTRLDSGLVDSSRWPKILKHFSKLLNNAVLSQK